MHLTLPEAQIHPGNVTSEVNGAIGVHGVLGLRLSVGVRGLVVLEGLVGATRAGAEFGIGGRSGWALAGWLAEAGAEARLGWWLGRAGSGGAGWVARRRWWCVASARRTRRKWCRRGRGR
jgi:hypothetical protein